LKNYVTIKYIKRHTPELITILALALAIVAIEMRHVSIVLSPRPQPWMVDTVSGYPRVMYDSSDEKLVIARKPARIVSTTMGSDEVLFGVCAGDRIVGASSVALDSRYSNVVEQVHARNIPIIGNVEQIVELRPDIVFVASYSPAEEIELLRSSGVAVFRLSNFDHISGIMGNIRAVGYAVGEDSCAAKLVRELRRRIENVARMAATHSKAPRVMVYGTGDYTEGANTLTDEMLHIVGARNVAAEHGVAGSMRISAEAITLWQPDFLVVGAAREDFDSVRRAMLSNPAIANSPVGRPGRIILIEDRYILCVSQYFAPAIEALARGLYGGGVGPPTRAQAPVFS
jgi:iron complex transport system substrate-binding protein